MAELGLLDVKAALAAALSTCTTPDCRILLPTETIAIEDAVGRVTAQPVHTRRSVRADPVAAMDGIAIHGRDAGPDPAEPHAPDILLSDRYDPIDTGDPLPAGRDTVVMRKYIWHRPYVVPR